MPSDKSYAVEQRLAAHMPLSAVKTVDLSRASTTTLAADPDLTVPVGASQAWWLDIMLLFRAVLGADFKWDLTSPAGSNLYGDGFGYDLSTGAAFKRVVYDANTGPGPVRTSGGAGTGTTQPWRTQGLFTTAGTAGSLTVRWAQNASSGTATVLLAGSYLIARKVS